MPLRSTLRASSFTAFVLAGLAGLAACSTSANDAAGRTEQGVSGLPGRTGTTTAPVAPSVYNVVGVTATGNFASPFPCTSIASPTGAWSAAQTFPGDTSLCTYSWTGAGAPDDVTLKATLAASDVMPDNIMADSRCSSGAPCARPTATDSLVKKNYKVGDGGGGVVLSCNHCLWAVDTGDSSTWRSRPTWSPRHLRRST